MRDARLPLAYRDSCAHLLIPLNQCRRETWYAPWKCTVRYKPDPATADAHTHSLPRGNWTGDTDTPLGGDGNAIDEQQADVEQDERHSYEKCQYVEFKKRVAKMDELRESKGGERSN